MGGGVHFCSLIARRAACGWRTGPGGCPASRALEGTPRRTDSNGLGLVIAPGIATAHSGTLTWTDPPAMEPASSCNCHDGPNERDLRAAQQQNSRFGTRSRASGQRPVAEHIEAGRRALSKGRRSCSTSRCRSADPGIDQEMSRITPTVSCPWPGRGWRAGSRGGAKCRRRHTSAARDGAEGRGQAPAPRNSLARRGRAYNSPLAPESAPAMRA